MIYPICKFLESHNYPSAVKTGLELRGWETGGLRKPFELLGSDPTEELTALLAKVDMKTCKAKWLSMASEMA